MLRDVAETGRAQRGWSERVTGDEDRTKSPPTVRPASAVLVATRGFPKAELEEPRASGLGTGCARQCEGRGFRRSRPLRRQLRPLKTGEGRARLSA